jgi:hypothetical protein
MQPSPEMEEPLVINDLARTYLRLDGEGPWENRAAGRPSLGNQLRVEHADCSGGSASCTTRSAGAKRGRPPTPPVQEDQAGTVGL